MIKNKIRMNKTILITGASSGIGKATANYFAEKGWNVVATMRNTADGEELTKLENVLVTKLDVTDETNIKEAIEKAVEKFGTIDILVNNAGYGAIGALESFPMENIRRQFDVNVFGLLATTRAVLPVMRKQKSGKIVNISSVVGRIAMPISSLYNATKWAVEGITEALQYELKPLGIDVKLVEPGAIETDFAGRSMDICIDEKLTDYKETESILMTAMQEMVSQSSKPIEVVKVIEKAIDSDELRHCAGEDAKAMLDMRAKLSDKDFFSTIREQFGLSIKK